MLIGHYGASLIVRRAEPRLSVSRIFVAAQVLDIVWCILVLVGAERLRIVPGVTATNALDLQFMPYSHSLPAALLWGAAAFAACRWVFSISLKPAVLLAFVVSAHWLLDWLVHRPDLLVWPRWPKAGLGLWNLAGPAFLLEAGLLACGFAMYLRQSHAVSQVGVYGMPALAAIMTAVQYLVFFGPVHMTARETVIWALAGYIAFPALAAALETQRSAGNARQRRHSLPWIAWP